MSKPIRYATFPLDCDALKAADDMMAKKLGSRRRLREDEYALRELWMDEYIKHGGKYSEKPQQRKPGQPVSNCPLAKKSEPVPKKPPAPPKPPPDLKCWLIAITATCQHKPKGAIRRVSTRPNPTAVFGFVPTVLGVVPDETHGGDTIELEAEVKDVCSGLHPEWTITDVGTKMGPKQSFQAKAPLADRLWIPTFHPKSYALRCECCEGQHHSLAVEAYPPNKLSVNIDVTKILQKTGLLEVKKMFEKVIDAIAGKFEVNPPNGVISGEAAWKEHTDHRAFYQYSIAIKLDPLIGGTFRIELGIAKITKIISKIPGIGNWLKEKADQIVTAKVFLEVKGKIGVDVKYQRSSPDQSTFSQNLGGGVSGSVELTLGGEASALGKDLIGVELAATGAVTASAESLIDEKGFGAQLKVEFGGLEGRIKFTMLGGLVEISESIMIIGSETLLGPKDVYFFEN